MYYLALVFGSWSPILFVNLCQITWSHEAILLLPIFPFLKQKMFSLIIPLPTVYCFKRDTVVINESVNFIPLWISYKWNKLRLNRYKSSEINFLLSVCSLSHDSYWNDSFGEMIVAHILPQRNFLQQFASLETSGKHGQLQEKRKENLTFYKS